MDPVAPFAFPPAYIGVGYGMPVPGTKAVRTDPVKEYVAGGFGFLQRNIPQVLPWMTDDLTRDFGPAVYDAMHTDPMVGSTFRLLKMQVLANGLKLTPAVENKPGDMSEHPDAPLAREIYEYCERSTLRCRTPIGTVFSEMFDCMRHGNKLAEVLCETETEGPDKGRIVLKDIKVKPRWSWLFVADVFMTLLGILAFDPAEGGFVVLPRNKFFILTWQMENNDPRGTSLYRQGYRFWNTKQNTIPELYKYVVQFGSPSVVGFTDPNEDGTLRQPIDSKGNELPNAAPVSSQIYMVQALEFLRNGAVAGFPSGAKVQLLQPTGNGEVLFGTLDYCDRQIVYGILGCTRDSLEAKNGSRADSDASVDKVGNLIRTAKELGALGYRNDVLHRLVELNWGLDIANRLTPKVSLGDTEHQDIVKLMTAVANLLRAGGIVKSQLPAIHTMLNLPPADPKDLEDDQPADAGNSPDGNEGFPDGEDTIPKGIEGEPEDEGGKQ